MDAASAVRLLRGATSATRVFAQVQRAKQGDQQALDYLRQQGWAEALDLLHPGVGDIGRELASTIGELRSHSPMVIDGEFREVSPGDMSFAPRPWGLAATARVGRLRRSRA